jgi:hypothetical protein
MAGDLQKQDRLFFKNLLIANTLRGFDSTGIASANDRGVTKVYKRAVVASELVLHKDFDVVANAQSQVLIGHTRAATVGKINHDTAHPFVHGNTVAAHNGTLSRWYTLDGYQQFHVDSDCLIYNLDKYGWEATIPKVRGAWAITMYDAETHELQIMRNDERPLYIVENVQGSCVYWASEKWMLTALAERCGIALSKKIYQPKANVLLRWQLPDKKYTKILPNPISQKIEVPVEEKKPQAPYPQYQQYQQYPAYRGTVYQRKAEHPRVYEGGQSSSGLSTNPAASRDKPSGAYLGELIQFVPIEKGVSATTGMTYLDCVMSSEPYFTVRVYMKEPNLQVWLNDGRNVTARVCAFSAGYGTDGAYLVCPEHGLEFVHDKQEAKKETVLYCGPAGSLISEAEFRRLTKDGCGNCTMPIDDNTDLEWFGDSPVCENCIDIVQRMGV